MEIPNSMTTKTPHESDTESESENESDSDSEDEDLSPILNKQISVNNEKTDPQNK